MCAPSSPAVRPFADGVPRRAASDASERASSGKKRPRVGVAPARGSSACLAKITTRNRNSVVAVAAAGMEVFTAGGEMPSQELLKKRLASELDALRGLLKKAELVSRRGASKGGAPAAGKKDRFLAANQRPPKPVEDGGCNAPSAKKRKIISTVVEQKQKRIPAPRMSPEERNQLAGRLSSLSVVLPGHIVEFLQKQFRDAEDSVLLELKTHLDMFAEESKAKKLVAEESRDDEVVLEQEDEEYIDICSLSPVIETGDVPPSSSSSSSGDSDSDSDSSGSESDSDSDSDGDEAAGRPAQVPTEQIIAQPPSEPAQQITAEARKVQDVQRAAPNADAVCMRGLLYRANLKRQLLEMERAALPDQSIHPWELERLGISQYGCPSVMRQIGLVLKE